MEELRWKTSVSATALHAAACRAAGLDAVAMKPAQSGVTPGEQTDADRLFEAMGGALALELVCPYSFAAPLAPAVAARLEGGAISFGAIVDRVRPSVEGLLATELRHDFAALVREGVRANIRASVNHLRHGSEILEQLIQDEGLRVVGAEYSLETGVVEFFEEAS